MRCNEAGNAVVLEINGTGLEGPVNWAALAKLGALQAGGSWGGESGWGQAHVYQFFLAGSRRNRGGVACTAPWAAECELTREGGSMPGSWAAPCGALSRQAGHTPPPAHSNAHPSFLGKKQNILPSPLPLEQVLNLYNNSLSGPLAGPLPPALTFFSVSLNYLEGPIPADWALPAQLQARAEGLRGAGAWGRASKGAAARVQGPRKAHYYFLGARGAASWSSLDCLGQPQATAPGAQRLTSFPSSSLLLTNPEKIKQELWAVGNGINGTLPEGLVLPDSLRQLSFYSNALSGPIPAGLRLPASLVNLVRARPLLRLD